MAVPPYTAMPRIEQALVDKLQQHVNGLPSLPNLLSVVLYYDNAEPQMYAAKDRAIALDIGYDPSTYPIPTQIARPLRYDHVASIVYEYADGTRGAWQLSGGRHKKIT